MMTVQGLHYHGVKSVRIRSYSGPHFPVFRLNTERYGVFLNIYSECGKMRTRITPNMDTFYALYFPLLEEKTHFTLDGNITSKEKEAKLS